MKFKTKRKAWNGPYPKSNTIYLENYNKIFKTKGKLVVETQKLEDFIRQVKVCAITLPVAISKLKMEDLH